MGFNLPLLSLRRRLLGSGVSFSPTALFALNEPGVWYDPSDVANLDWRRNLLTWTEQFDNAAWTKASLTVTANGSTAPDGTTTGDRIIESNDGSTVTTHSITSAVSLTVGVQYVFSFYAKGASSGRHVWVGGGGIGGASEYPIFNVTSGAVDLAATTTIVKSATIAAPDANGWRRCSVTFVPTATTAPGIGLTASATDNANVGYVGNGTSGVDIWGAQLELGSTATEYQRITDVNTEVIERFPSATLYQDTAGTTPVATPGQSVALALDKSKGLVLGSEQSPTLPNYQTVLTGTWAASGANYVFTDTAGGQSRPGVQWPSISLLAGWYQIVVVVAAINGATQIRLDGVGATDQLLTVGTNTRIVNVTSTSRPRFRLEDLSTTIGDSFTITSVSVKELPGFHATQATAGSRPIYGIVPVGGRRNLLTFTEQFDNAAWSIAGTTISANASTAPNGSNTAERATNSTGSGAKYVLGTPPYVASTGQAVTHSCYVKSDGYSKVALRESAATGAYASFDLSTASVIETGNAIGIVVSNATITNVGSGWYRISMTCTNSVANQTNGFGLWFLSPSYTTGQPNGQNWAGNGTSGFLIWGAQLETGSTATAYQRVVSQYDVTEAGVSALSYLAFDGVDDFLVTPTITPGIDKAQVFAGVRKLSDAAAGALVELSANVGANAGSLWLFAPGSSGGPVAFDWFTRGNAGVAVGQTITPSVATYPAPGTFVLTGTGDIAADNKVLRVNGDVAGTNTADQGTGNFLAYPLYIGRRGGTTLPFSGNIYSLIVRFGANLTADQITSTETWVNGKTRAY